MCGAPSVPKPAPVPMAPDYSQVDMDQEIQARNVTRRRAAQAMSTRASMLAGDYTGGSGKTLLGQ